MEQANLFSDGNPRIELRLGERHKRIIDANQDAFEGASVLDIASNNGRWSYAALSAGARHVTSIEGRQDRVDEALASFETLGLSDKVDCNVGDMFEWLWVNSSNQFDTVLCLGVYYHITDHYGLLKQIVRTQPKTIIIDSGFVRSFRNAVYIKTEDPSQHKNALPVHQGQAMEFVGSVTLGMMIQMAWNLGYSCRPVVWDPEVIENRAAVSDYMQGARYTLRLDKMDGFRDDDWAKYWTEALTKLSPKYKLMFDPAKHDRIAEQPNITKRSLVHSDCSIMDIVDAQPAPVQQEPSDDSPKGKSFLGGMFKS